MKNEKMVSPAVSMTASFLADLMDNTIECLNQELYRNSHKSDSNLVHIYRDEITMCEGIIAQIPNNLYLVSQDHISGMETYDSYVAVAPTVEAAVELGPKGDMPYKSKEHLHDWAQKDKVEAKFIGTSTLIKAQVLCASFHAG